MYQPTMSLEVAKSRADLISKIRSFFHSRNVLEVETPLLSKGAGLDPYIDVYQTDHFIDGTESAKNTLYLSTSPEFFMKRMLASGYPAIFQLCKAFRNGEEGERHNPEFTILEWYRPGMSYKELMAEVFDLVNGLSDFGRATYITYRDLFMKYLHVDPFSLSIEDCIKICTKNNISIINGVDIQEWLIYIFSMLIEPSLGFDAPLFLSEYPAEQAALAQVFTDEHGNRVARRFELYINGVELCNGYEELIDAEEQRERFVEDIRHRRLLGKRTLAMDENFLNALEAGMPACSGVALGVDRLLMLVLKQESIQDVISFPYKRV